LHNLNSITSNGIGVQVVQNWNIYREQRDSEAFINGHHAYTSTRTQATLPTLGANGLGALMALLDGPATTKEAAAIVGYTYDAMARTLRRYAEHGLVEVDIGQRNLKMYTLKAEWRDILKANLPKMPTYGVQLARHVDALKSKEAMAIFRGEDAKAAKVGQEYLRMAALLERVKETAGIIPFVRPERSDKVAERLDRLRDIQRAGERAETRPKLHTETDADQWRRREYAKDLAATEREWPGLNAWATMEHGEGWWTRRDQTEIIGQYRIFQIVGNQAPTMHWAGQEAVAA
jgi:DNA-binding transcriptional ArsR family regulator